MSTKRNTKLVMALLVLTIYGTCIVLLRGEFPNQTATLVNVDGNRIQSLMPRQNISRISLSLACEAWNISGQNVTLDDSEGTLTISGSPTDKEEPLFVAKQIGLELNFTEKPYLHLIVNSTPDTEISFFLGWPSLNSSAVNNSKAITEIDYMMGIIWINISYPLGGQTIDEKLSYITIDVAHRLAKFGLDNQRFIGFQIKQYLVGRKPFDKNYTTMIKFAGLLDKSLYTNAPAEGKSQNLLDGSLVHIIKRNDIINQKDCPYLQRIHILYTMNAAKEMLYTIFLLSKNSSSEENLVAVRSGFVFVHKSVLNEISTYVDWRRPIPLDYAFEPIASLSTTMNDGDYAIIFAPLEKKDLQENQVHKVQFTFSKLPYSAFVITEISDEVRTIVSIFILTIAGTLPTVLMCYLFYLHRKNRLGDDKGTIIKIAILGLALRSILAPVAAYADDTQIFAEIGALYFGSGVLGAQWVSLPGFVYLETAAYFPYTLLRAAGFQDFQFLALDVYSVELFFTKILAILSDLGSFYFILKMANKCVPKKNVLLSGLYLLNPLTIYVSSVLGQFDSIFTFAVIASIYYLVAEYNTLKATSFSSFAAILNPVGIATFIPLLTSVYFRKGRKDMFRSLLLATGIFGVLMLPFFFEQNSPVLLASYERLMGAVPGESFYGLKIDFYTYGTWIQSSVGYGLTFRFLLENLGFELGPLFFPYAAAFIFVVFVSIFIYKVYKAHVEGTRNLIYTGTFMLIVASLFQLTFPMIFDQFVVWVVGLLIVSYVLSQNKRLLSIFTIISVSTGFIYVLTWRNYLQLISGVEAVPLGNPFVATVASTIIGTLYSLILLITIIIILRIWTQKTVRDLFLAFKVWIQKLKRLRTRTSFRAV